MCRTSMGWLALLPLACCVGSAALFAWTTLGSRTCLEKQTGDEVGKRLLVVHGGLLFRVGASLEFLVQLMFLRAADLLRYRGHSAPQWKLGGYICIVLTWLLTFWGPSDVSQAPGPLDHVIVLTGASARLGIFLYCLSHSFKRSFGLCCSRRLTDWRILTSEPCAPGKPRLRHMTYYILTRPQYLLLVNLPFGYPVDFLAPFALTIRCGFALLLALALKPARPELLKAHDIEAETRENFDTALASHLCEYAWESYVGPPPPNAVVVSGARTDVDGEYLLEGEHLGAPLYSRSTEILEGGRRLLRKGVNDWEIVAVSGGSTVQMAYVRDEAASPNRITGQWIEWDEEGFGISGRVARDNELLSVQSSRDSDRTVGRRFEQRGVCPDTDMHWLVVEEGLDGGQVSITVAFRGTSSWQNVLTDAKIGLTSVTQSSASSNAPEVEVAEPNDLEDTLQDGLFLRVRQRLKARRSLKPVTANTAPFDLELLREWMQVEETAPATRLNSPLMPFDVDAHRSEREGSLYRACRCVGRFFLGLLCPFHWASDIEEDDEPFDVATLLRVRLHVGFSASYASVRQEVMDVVNQRLAESEKEHRRVHVRATGHSLGGAVASIFAFDLVVAKPHISPVVYTFGSPRVGNAAFRSIYNVRVPSNFRIVAPQDAVPALPPSVVYRQLGREVWFDDFGERTYVMSWAMRKILPPRNSFHDHSLVVYREVLEKALKRDRDPAGAMSGEDNWQAPL